MSRLLSLNFVIEILGVMVIVTLVGVVLHLISLELIGAHNMNNMTIYVTHLVVIAFVSHLLCELTGVNHWYCKNGVACKE